MAASKGFKYLGPSENIQLVEGGTVYHPGDTLPCSAEVAEQLVRDKHWIEGFDLPSTGDGQAAELPKDVARQA